MFCIFVLNVMEKEKNDDTYFHILKYTSLFGGVQGLNILVGLVRNKLVAMILGPDGMGIVSLFNSTIRFISDSTGLGIPTSAVKNLSQSISEREANIRDTVQLVRSWSLLAALVGLLACVILSPLLNDWTFSWGDHTLHFVLLSPVIALMAITGGEVAILKAARRLRALAMVSVYGMLLALFISVPIYYFFGQAGIVPSLVLMALSQCILTIAYSYRLYRPSFAFGKKEFRDGQGMVKLGIAYVGAGVMGSGAEFVVRSYLNNVGDLGVVGLYNAGFVMTITYASMVFSSMETDYYPRLSGIKEFGHELNLAVNRQIEVSLLLLSPLLVFFMVSLPVLLPLLYSGKFLPILAMMKIAVLAMYFKALTLPVEYIALARGDSWSHLLLETIYAVFFVLLVVLGYSYLGLVGTGLGLALTGLVFLAFVYAYAHWRYRYVASASVKAYALAQVTIGVTACVFTLCLDGILYWIVGLILAMISLVISIWILRSKSALWDALRKRFMDKWNRAKTIRHKK